MGIMDLVRRIGNNKKEVKMKYKEAETDMKVQNLLEERQKSSNRRELERYLKEQEEARIKVELDKIHKQNNKELWKSKNMILKKEKSILKDDRPILKEKNIFMDNKINNPFLKKQGMFFK